MHWQINVPFVLPVTPFLLLRACRHWIFVCSVVASDVTGISASTAPTPEYSLAEGKSVAIAELSQKWGCGSEGSTKGVVARKEHVSVDDTVTCLLSKWWGKSTIDEKQVYMHSKGAGEEDVYGELASDGFRQMLEMIPQPGLGVDDAFWDFGSGRGGVVLRASLVTEAGSCIGVEKAEHRHRMASDASHFCGQACGHARFLSGDMLQAEVGAVTVAWAANLLWPDSLLHAFCELLADSTAPGTILISLRRCPGQPSSNLVLVREFVMAESWNKQQPSFLYVRVTTHEKLYSMYAAGMATLPQWTRFGKLAEIVKRLRVLIPDLPLGANSGPYKGPSLPEMDRIRHPPPLLAADTTTTPPPLSDLNVDVKEGSKIHAAARRGDMVSLRMLLKTVGPAGVSQAREGDGDQPLHVAYGKGIVDALVEKKADVNAVDNMGRTPLHTVVVDELRCFEGVVAVTVGALLEHGANPALKDKEGRTPLHDCRDGEGGKVLASQNPVVASTARDLSGLTALEAQEQVLEEVVEAMEAGSGGRALSREYVNRASVINAIVAENHSALTHASRTQLKELSERAQRLLDLNQDDDEAEL